MKKNLFKILIIVFFCFGSCEKKIKIEGTFEQIKVDVQEKYYKGNFENYFSSSKIIALETNEYSLFHSIDRISFYEKKIFILDRKSNAVLIFNDNGQFLNKIQATGKGPGEYISLYDFAINKSDGQIILYSDRPYKLLTYNINGQFIKEEKTEKFYFNMAFLDNKLLFMTKDTNSEKMLFEYDLGKETKRAFLEMDEKDSFFYGFDVASPTLTTCKNVLISQPYSEKIYEYDGKKVKPKYFIDFGDHKVSDNIINELAKNHENIYEYIAKNNYGFVIKNFRENKNYITFNFYNNGIVIYSKISKKSKSFRFFKNNNDLLPFYNYFAHDGDNDKIISIYASSNFKEQMNIYKEKEKLWNRVPQYIKEIENKISENDNPLLLIYTFKE